MHIVKCTIIFSRKKNKPLGCLVLLFYFHRHCSSFILFVASAKYHPFIADHITYMFYVVVIGISKLK